MPKVPKKNVSPDLHDVKWPKKNEPQKPEVLVSMPKPPKRTQIFWPAVSFASIIILLGSMFAWGTFSSGAEEKKESSTANIRDLFDRGFKTFRNLKNFSSNTFGLIDDLSNIQSYATDALRGENGDKLIASLKTAKERISILANEAEELHRSGNEKFLPLGGKNPLTIGSNLSGVADFLSEFIPWLEGEKRMVVLFQNPSELRPSGGFLGSFAEVNISGGAVKDIRVYDINEVDKDLGLKFAPPQALSALSSRWYTRDSNWFFGFPDSAEAAIAFMESSAVFKNENKKIDGVISVSGKVMEDILKITGPIDLKGENITLISKNFLREIQRDIQENREGKDNQPKKILKEIMPIMLERLSELSAKERRDLLVFAKEWSGEKDVMIYMRNKEMQNFFVHSGLGGDVYSLPKNFEGDYLAIISSNMASGKSDIVIKRNIDLISQIGIDGTITNELVIRREHKGNIERSWWYNTPNESYLKILVPEDSYLENLSGAFKKTRFKSATFEKYWLVNEMESGSENVLTIPEAILSKEYGKRAISFWTRLSPGEKKEIKLEYTHKTFSRPAAGKTYEFIFEKQAGTQGEYFFELIAPIGFIWSESGSPVYEYRTSDPPGRLILKLTLEKEV